MKCNANHFVAVCLLALAAVLAGCSPVRWSGTTTVSSPSLRPPRDDAAIDQFERNRELAEYEAARAAWRRGDGPGCQSRLEQLLARSPNNQDARLLMADFEQAASRKVSTTQVPKRESVAAHVPAVPEAKAVADHAEDRRDDRGVVPVGFSAPSGPPINSVRREEAASIGSAEMKMLDRAMLPSPTLPEPIDATIRRGSDSLTAGDTKGAMDRFREAIAASPADPQVSTAAALAAIRGKHPELAIDLLRPQMERCRDSIPLRQTLAIAYCHRGEFEASRNLLQQTLALDRSSALSHYLMGYVLTQIGERGTAGSHLRQAQKLDPRYALDSRR